MYQNFCVPINWWRNWYFHPYPSIAKRQNTYIASYKWDIGEQCRPKWDAAYGSSLFASKESIYVKLMKKNQSDTHKIKNWLFQIIRMEYVWNEYPLEARDTPKKRKSQTRFYWVCSCAVNTVDSRYLDFCYLELPLISKRKYDSCFNIEI